MTERLTGMESVTTVESPGARDTRAKSNSSRRGEDGSVLSTDALAALINETSFEGR